MCSCKARRVKRDMYTKKSEQQLCENKEGAAEEGILTAEVVKYYFPKLVEMHNYVPANSMQQKLSNWTTLNRKVLNKLNFSVPEDVMRKIVQCSPGVVELVLYTLRQKIEEKLKQNKMTTETSQELGHPVEENNYTDAGYPTKQKNNPTINNVEHPSKGQHVSKSQHQGYTHTIHGDTSFRIQLAEKEHALQETQEAVQILQLKVRRLEQLLQMKNIRIDDLTRRLQQAEKKSK
ncbi:sperm flagellar protein 1 isoform X2 [Rhinatrema bivittatum]|uniref:sperm flagellar protein 1 isoform X2 n=1 Tax=Rhinatrema bivittatum TaxID=194408 RepID=UPI00112B0F67|nr:sperm flagellar protein 1 isoform X2 [Rhinatrema bivittatum]